MTATSSTPQSPAPQSSTPHDVPIDRSAPTTDHLSDSAPYNFLPRVHLGMHLCVGDNKSGTIEDVLIDRDTRCARFVVVNYGGFFGVDLVMPVTWLTDVDETCATTRASMAEVHLLPRYTVGTYGPAQGLLSQCAGRYDRRPHNQHGHVNRE